MTPNTRGPRKFRTRDTDTDDRPTTGKAAALIIDPRKAGKRKAGRSPR